MNLSRGLTWKLLERVLYQGIKFIVQIILARLIAPEEYGVLSILLVFIAFADIITQSGLNTALIQKEKIDDTDISTVFWFSIAIAGVLYLILFLTAPFIANYYQEEILIPTLRVISLCIFFVAANGIQIAYVSRKLDFKSVFISSLASCLISGGVGIFLAYNNFGIWALVIYYIMGFFLNVVCMFPFAHLKIWKVPSLKSLKTLLPFGIKLMFSTIIATVTENLYNLILGKRYNTEIVGYYTRGQQFPHAISTSISATVSSVLLPYLSKNQTNLEHIKKVARKSVSMATYIMFPILGGLFAIAELMVVTLLTDKWLPCVTFLRLECLFYATIPMMNAAGQGCVALGRSDISLKIEMFKSVPTVAFIFVIMNFTNVYYVVGIRVIVSLITFLFRYILRKKFMAIHYLTEFVILRLICLLQF